VSKPLAIALDLGGTQARAALINRAGEILARKSENTKAQDSGDVVLAQLANLAQIVAVGHDWQTIAGVGLSSPGPVDTTTGTAFQLATIPGLNGLPMQNILEQSLSLPVRVENDGTAAAIGEWRFGAGRGHDHLVYVTVSTGIGGGVICDGSPLRGRRGLAAEVGHLRLVPNGEVCGCGIKGCFEAYASGTALAKRARKRMNNTALDTEMIFAAAKNGDAAANTLIDEEAAFLGQGFATLLHLYSPDLIIMGGGVSAQFERLHQGMVRELNANAMPAFQNTPIVKAALGGHSGLIGAASLIFDLR
jgi:glucokinase